MAFGARWLCVIAAAALAATAACSSDKSSTPTTPPATTAAASAEPPPAPARSDGRMPDEEFAQFTAFDDDVASGLTEWQADARECTALGKSGDLDGFRECVGNVWTEANDALSKAGSNTAALSDEVATECRAAAEKYTTALTNLRAAAALARGFADSLDVKSMPGALRSLAKGRKAYETASTQVRAACKPS